MTMAHVCRTCSRVNPAEAQYCFHDGTSLDGHGPHAGPMRAGALFFRQPFVFPSGVSCRTFDELALACQGSWQAARDLLEQGYLERFLGGLGRADLALAAREAARFPDRDRGLDEFLAKLPSKALHPPSLNVEPLQINLGVLKLGQDRRFALRLRNGGMRLLYGTVTCVDSIWLTVGDAPGGPRKLFQFADDSTIPVHVVGRRLRAGNKPLEGKLLVESNGGVETVLVRAEVPVTPFPAGALAGALSPRQIAEKAKASPREAALLFEQGAVERWYQSNGWTYPVQGPAASGISAVQQFFEALGLTTPPRVEISEQAVHLLGHVGERLEHELRVETQEKRPVYAHAVSDQPWLRIGPIALEGRSATIPLEVPAVPPRPGEHLQGRVTVTANGNQRFWVSVLLSVGERLAATRTAKSTVRSAIQAAPPVAPTAQAISAIPYATPAPQSLAPPRPPVAQLAVALTEPGGGSKSVHFVPVLLLCLALLGIIARDLLLPDSQRIVESGTVEAMLDKEPRIDVRFHDGKKGDDADRALPDPTMRFGLLMLREKDPRKPDKLKRLTFDEFGRSNNTVLLIDGSERFFGEPRHRREQRYGEWETLKAPLQGDGTGRNGDGMESVWKLIPERIIVHQIVEVVAGEQSRVLDTCRVRYILENQDTAEHRVGIRFMLDTFIGTNDGVPFTIPGKRDLCDTHMEFTKKQDVPDFIQALERDDLRNPGTIAQIQFKLGGRVESPDRVTLGAWPHTRFSDYGFPKARAQNTGWDVPVLDIRRLNELVESSGERADPDSCVVMYWNPQPLGPGKKREVGFSYGLGTVSSGEGGQNRLALTVGGRLVAHGEFTLTALVHDPRPDEMLTLTLPADFSLVEGKETQAVPPLPAESTQRNSPVTWKIKAAGDGRYTLKVKSSRGATQTQAIRIRTKGVFD
jgi:hypothetical protein